MNKAIRIAQTGGPEVMQLMDVAIGTPGAGEVCIQHKACGLNFIDVYHRTGLYKQLLPTGLGVEGAGIVEAVGPDVHHVKVGDRVAYAGGPPGAYAQRRIMPASVLVKLPDSISFDVAAAVMLQGLTVQYLFCRTYKIQSGQTILFHAAAGGVGLLACQWAKALGVTMIGTVGSAAKAALAKANGCAHVINYNEENFVERVEEITAGRGVSVVYDSIGKDTFFGSLDCLSPLGTMVSFGNASGPVPDFNLSELASRGSLFITRPSMMHYTAVRSDLEQMAAELFAMIETKKLIVHINQRYALADVGKAHRELEARKTTGCSILIPDAS
ncbi:quinone oxidoreductase family protein [Solimicrobium silvestre]|nr:quinone oxidoreductase [Solimicrobium silvestre]